MRNFRIIPDATHEIAIKRFNLPATAIDTCPTCGKECSARFDGDDYISYPKIGVPTTLWLYCRDCAKDWERRILIHFSVEAINEDAP